MPSPSRGLSAVVHVRTVVLLLLHLGPALTGCFPVGRTFELFVVIQIVWILYQTVL